MQRGKQEHYPFQIFLVYNAYNMEASDFKSSAKKHRKARINDISSSKSMLQDF
jgi:hypothetical protein